MPVFDTSWFGSLDLTVVSMIWFLLLLLIIQQIVYQRFLSPLASIPGPFLASVSRFWLIRRMFAGDVHTQTEALHKKYGPLVRIGTNEISCSDPAALKTIYASNSGWFKTDWYLPFGPNISPHEDGFTQLDENKHTFRRKMIQSTYSMTSILESEPYMDHITEAFFERMSQFAESSAIVDMVRWLQFYTADVASELFFGHAFGCVENGKDVEGYIGAVDDILVLTVVTAACPKWIRPLAVLLYPFSASFRHAISRFESLKVAAIGHVHERLEGKFHRPDMLEKLLDVFKVKSPDFDITDVYTESYVSIVGGVDTVAIVLRSVVYYLCRNPCVYEKVLAEIDTFHGNGQLSEFISYAQAVKMPYTMATIKEAMRIHPSNCMTFPRHVSKGGAVISGFFFPEGYVLGINPYILHRNKDIFGLDAEEFNPDRWFRPDANIMDTYMFQFGKGSRTCQGQHIAIAEISKFVPQFLRAFKLELVDPEKEWTIKNWWLTKQFGIDCRVSKRDITPAVW